MRKTITLTVVMTVAASALLGAGFEVVSHLSETPAVAASVCPVARGLRVTAAPEIAPVLAAVLQRESAGDSTGCPVPTVLSGDPATAADLLSRPAYAEAGPDVWIPDSSLWVAKLSSVRGGAAPEAVSVARSPIVAALPAPLAAELPAAPGAGWTSLLPASGAVAGPVRWAFPNASGSLVTTAALVGVRTALDGRPTSDADLATTLRAAALGGGSDLATRLTLAAQQSVAVPATEQEVYAYDRSGVSHLLAAAYPAASQAMSADYPFVVLTRDDGMRRQAAALLATLQGGAAVAALRAAGFRDGHGVGGEQLLGQRDVDGRQVATGPGPDAAAVATSVTTLARLTQGSQMLAVVDISGSMATKVPGAAGATRLDVALRATVTGLATYPDDTKAGLWTFSTNLTPTTDYRELVPLVPLGRGPDGSSGRARLAQGLAGIAVKPRGGTGLYDTILAATRALRDKWDPTMVNSVVLVTDGVNDDDSGGIDLPTLVRTLTAENDPAKPIYLFPIALGPSTDLGALQQVVATTGGKVYATADPRAIGDDIKDAIGRRAS